MGLLFFYESLGLLGLDLCAAIVRAVGSSAASVFIIFKTALFAAATTVHPAAFGPDIFFQLLLRRRCK